MTEKRFNDAKGYIYDKKTCIGIIQDDYTCENIVDLLNSLNDENEKLKTEIKQLKQPSCRKCIHYSNDGVADYCMCKEGLLGDEWEMFPFEWDYIKGAKECKEYEE